jgi:predicted deacylase
LSKRFDRSEQQQTRLQRKLPELTQLERIIEGFEAVAADHSDMVCRVGVEAEIVDSSLEMVLPVYSMVIGSPDKAAPCLAIVGGVHGLERIGSEVVLAWMQVLLEQLRWDSDLQDRLTRTRLVFIPIVNPYGMAHHRRSNRNHIDLARNAPVEADESAPFLLGGHRLSKWLPWYRGHVVHASEMEPEMAGVFRVFSDEVLPSSFSMSVDVHSGFGSVDRLWFPYARTQAPPPDLSEVMALKRLYDQTYPQHVYQLEPQASAYTNHGDIWDYLYDLSKKQGQDGVQTRVEGPSPLYIPWTLELGSWLWLRKNPRQFFSALGAFHPVQPHRIKRILRRHISLFDFLHRAVANSKHWLPDSSGVRSELRHRALELWYRDLKGAAR